MIQNIKLIKEIEIELMINGFCQLKYIGNGKDSEIVTLEEHLDFLKSLKDKKELNKNIKRFEEMINIKERMFYNQLDNDLI